MSNSSPPGDRIAKVISRSGRASRREAERLIEEGRVAVNGAVIDRAALNVTPKDRIEIDGIPLDAPEPPRLWLYHKPTGLVTTTRDEQGRPTIYDELPDDLPRVMSVGRLDLNSEGLLLLTNDGGVKRRLELPSTGWLRRYRVRLKGRPQDSDFDALREGITLDGETFQPMIVSLDRQQGANAWVTVALREGKNREIRRAMEALGLSVNRLIRLSYGPFQLAALKPGEVQEVRGRVLRDQLGLSGQDADHDGGAAPAGKRPASVTRRRGKTAGAGAEHAERGTGRQAERQAGRQAGRRDTPDDIPDKPRGKTPGTTPGKTPGKALSGGGKPGHSSDPGRGAAGTAGQRRGTRRSGTDSSETAPSRRVGASRTGSGKTGQGQIGSGKAGSGKPGTGPAAATKPRGGADKTGAGRAGAGKQASRKNDTPGKPAGKGRDGAGQPAPRRSPRHAPGQGGKPRGG